MVTNAQLLFKELEAGITQPLYLVVGEEPFQSGEILTKIRQNFCKSAESRDFSIDVWEAESGDVQTLLSHLNTLPSLFDTGDKRLVICQRFEKMPAASLEKLEGYFKDPNPTTSFLMLATKVDKRKAWYRAVEDKGYVLEVNEPYDRDWPKWQPYFERKSSKRIDSRAWDRLVEAGGRSLSLVWAEVQKATVFVGDKNQISLKDVEVLSASSGADIFEFAEDVLHQRKFEAFRKYDRLMFSGESEIKLLSILVRQFRLVDQCQGLMRRGQQDSKAIAGQIGVHPFFVAKIQAQAKARTSSEIAEALVKLSECDYRLKLGEGNLFESFLVPYFSAAPAPS